MEERVDRLELGTLSFARCDGEMIIAPRERLRLILAAAQAYCPDLLITAGHSVHSRAHFDELGTDFAQLRLPSTIITEVLHDGPQARARQTHAMYAVNGEGQIHRFGRQLFAKAEELRGEGEQRLAQFEHQLAERSVALGDWNVFGLICGELNIVRGRRNPRFRIPSAGDAIMAADVIINPTHDRMGNAGTLDAKRRLLSLASFDRRNRVYVSCSNWEACGNDSGRIQHVSKTLHTVYVAGAPVEPDAVPGPCTGAFGFHYRHWTLRL